MFAELQMSLERIWQRPALSVDRFPIFSEWSFDRKTSRLQNCLDITIWSIAVLVLRMVTRSTIGWSNDHEIVMRVVIMLVMEYIMVSIIRSLGHNCIGTVMGSFMGLLSFKINLVLLSIGSNSLLLRRKIHPSSFNLSRKQPKDMAWVLSISGQTGL